MFVSCANIFCNYHWCLKSYGPDKIFWTDKSCKNVTTSLIFKKLWIRQEILAWQTVAITLRHHWYLKVMDQTRNSGLTDSCKNVTTSLIFKKLWIRQEILDWQTVAITLRHHWYLKSYGSDKKFWTDRQLQERYGIIDIEKVMDQTRNSGLTDSCKNVTASLMFKKLWIRQEILDWQTVARTLRPVWQLYRDSASKI